MIYAKTGFNWMKKAGAIDIGGTKTLVGVIGADGQVMSAMRIPTFRGDCFACLAQAAVEIEKCLCELGLAASDLAGIGVNMPGMVDSSNGILIDAPFARWRNVNVSGFLGGLLKTESISVENDVNACAIGEHFFGGDGGDFLWITASTGIGGAFFSGGRLVRGSGFCAGELGHVKVEYDRPALCPCGQSGCVEAHASGSAIGRMLLEKAGENPSLKAEIKKRGLAFDAATCAMLAREGVEEAAEIFNTAGMYIGRALGATANLLNPSKIYMGGGVANSLDLFIGALKKEFESCAVGQCSDVNIIKTALGYEAALKGAAASAFLSGGRGQQNLTSMKQGINA